jgi:hypothetical protein
MLIKDEGVMAAKKAAAFAKVQHRDIESLAEKLDVMVGSLTAGERAALARVILNAASGGRHGTAHALKFSGPLATSLALGSNFTEAGQVDPVVAIAPGELRSKERVYFRGVTR